MRSHIRRPVAEPLFDGLNITPLIDVMLVLLVMFILAVPAMMHKIPVDLPQPGPVSAAERVLHRIDLNRAGVATIDGVAVTDGALASALARLKDDPRTEVFIRTDPETRYERFDEVMAVLKRSGITRLGFMGHERMTF